MLNIRSAEEMVRITKGFIERVDTANSFMGGEDKMKNLVERMVAARDLAANREPDLRFKALIAAMTFLAHENKPSSVRVICHCRAWMACFEEKDLVELEPLSQEDLSHRLAYWIQAALDQDNLILSDPPLPIRPADAMAEVGGKHVRDCYREVMSGYGGAVDHDGKEEEGWRTWRIGRLPQERGRQRENPTYVSGH